MIDPSSSEEEDDDEQVSKVPIKPPHMVAHKGPPAGVRIEHANGHGPHGGASPLKHPGAAEARAHPTHPNRDTGGLRKDNVHSDSSGSLAPGPSLPRTPSPSSTLSQDTADASGQRGREMARSASPSPSMTSDKNEVLDPQVRPIFWGLK